MKRFIKTLQIRFFETDEHGFGDQVIIGFKIKSELNDIDLKMESAEIAIVPINPNFASFNDFFAEFNGNTSSTTPTPR